MDDFAKQCQSCGMPLKNGENSGTEKDGSKSKKYCQLCYMNGEFLKPDMTLEEMKKVLDDTIGKEGLKGKFIAWMGKMQLPKLERWQK
jgi:hypothetical protein